MGAAEGDRVGAALLGGALPRRAAAECLTEELRRLDPDEVYGEVLSTGLERLRTIGRISRTKVKVGA